MSGSANSSIRGFAPTIAAWAQYPDGNASPPAGVVLDVIGPAVEPPVLAGTLIAPNAVDPRWHVVVSLLSGNVVPPGFAAAKVIPERPVRMFLAWHGRDRAPAFQASLVVPATPSVRVGRHHASSIAAPVPTVIPAWNGKAALREAGRLDMVEGAVQAAGGRVRDAWDGAAEWSRDSPFIGELTKALGLEPRVVDQMFREADAIRS